MLQRPFNRIFWGDCNFLIGVPSDFLLLFLSFCLYPCKSLLPLNTALTHSIALKFTTSLSEKHLILPLKNKKIRCKSRHKIRKQKKQKQNNSMHTRKSKVYNCSCHSFRNNQNVTMQ